MKGCFLFLLAVSLVLLLATGCEEDADTGTGTQHNPLPSVRIVAPVNDEPVCDYVEVIATASDDKGVAEVKFYVDADLIGSDAAPPYSVIWDASTEDHASVHSVYGVAYDTDENKVGSPTVLCVIDTGLATPDAPIIHAIDSVTGTTARVVWSANTDPDFERYVLRYDTSSSAEPSMYSVDVVSCIDTTYTVTGLRDTATYYFRVYVRDIFSHMSASTIEQVTTPNVAPPKPVFYSIMGYSDRIRFEWAAATVWDFSDYKIVRSVDSIYDLSDEVLVTISDINTVIYDYMTTDTTEYYHFVVVSDIYGYSTHSDAYFGSSYVNFALEFNGSTYATVPYFTGLNVGNTYTLEAWVYQTGRSDFMRVIDKSPPGSPYLQYSLISDDYLGADVCADGSPGRYHASAGVTLNEWHHIALTYDFGTIIYYIDGEPIDTSLTGISTSCSFETTLNIGRRRLYDEFYFHGIIDEVRVWNVARTPSEILDTYGTRLVGTEPNLVCYYNFDEGQGDVFYSPVGGSGHLGSVPGVDSRDAGWVESIAPLQ